MLPWARRSQAAALLAAMSDPDRGFDAIVVGEYERAFYGAQYAAMAPLFEYYGVQLWTPETGGPVDFGAGEHEQLMLALACNSRGDHPHQDPGPGRNGGADPYRYPGLRSRHRRPQPLTSRRHQQDREEGDQEHSTRADQGQARVTVQPARKRPLIWEITCPRGT